MASRNTYECYICKRNRFDNVRVYLDGKTADGKTIYKNEDMSPHQHKSKTATNTANAANTITTATGEATAAAATEEEGGQQQPKPKNFDDLIVALGAINRKLDAIIDRLDKRIEKND